MLHFECITQYVNYISIKQLQKVGKKSTLENHFFYYCKYYYECLFSFFFKL